jgi:4-hydroxy-4-methyl-2-oxoglutarate aldolase
MKIFARAEDVIALTPNNPFDRYPDGRPRIPDDLIERLKLVTTEEAWGTMRKHGYEYQFEGNWLRTHPDQILVGRALPCTMVPLRPDLQEVVEAQGKVEGRIGGQNSWVIDELQMGDVLVVDLFGKVRDGTFVGDNLSTSVRKRTRAGAVIDGGIRDFQGIAQLTDVTFYHRGMDPTAIKNVTLAGVNIPVRIGNATVMPGDAVLGTPTGIIFIPPHLIQEVVERSEDIRVRDTFGKLRLQEGKYTPGEIDRVWSEEIEADFREWLKANPPT